MLMMLLLMMMMLLLLLMMMMVMIVMMMMMMMIWRWWRWWRRWWWRWWWGWGWGWGWERPWRISQNTGRAQSKRTFPGSTPVLALNYLHLYLYVHIFLYIHIDHRYTVYLYVYIYIYLCIESVAEFIWYTDILYYMYTWLWPNALLITLGTSRHLKAPVGCSWFMHGSSPHMVIIGFDPKPHCVFDYLHNIHVYVFF